MSVLTDNFNPSAHGCVMAAATLGGGVCGVFSAPVGLNLNLDVDELSARV